MSVLELATKAQLLILAEDPPPAGSPPNPGPHGLPPKITAAGDTIIGILISLGGIVAVVALVAAFILLMIGEEGRGSGGAKIMKVLFGVAGMLGAGWIIQAIW